MSVRLFLRDLTGFAGANLARSLLPFLLMPVLTAKLGTTGYGTLALLEVTILIFTPLLLFNSPALISTRYYQLDADGRRQTITASLALAFILTLSAQAALLIVGKRVAIALGLPDSFYLLLPLFILVRIITTYITGIYQIQQRAALYGAYSVGMLACDLGLSLLFVVQFDWGYKGRLLGSHLAMFIASIVGLRYLWREHLLGGRLNGTVLRDILRYGFPLIPHALGGVVLAMSSRYLIEYYKGAAAVGMYAATYQLASALLLIGTTINQVWSISLFKLLSEGVATNRRTIRRLFAMNIAFLFVATIAIYSLKDVLFGVFLHSEFRAALPLFPWLLIGFLFQSLYFIFVNFDFYDGSTTRIGVVTLGAAALNILLNVLWLPRFGISGAAWAATASMAIYFFAVAGRVVLFSTSFRSLWTREGNE